jgi:hypothetical protein
VQCLDARKGGSHLLLVDVHLHDFPGGVVPPGVEVVARLGG